MALRTAMSYARVGGFIAGSGLGVVAAVTAAVLLGFGLSGVATAASARGGPKPRVWTVGTWHGKRGQFRSIQAAVDAAAPGDWIVIAPGDYKERGDYTTHRPVTAPAARVWIDKPDLHLLGLSRGGGTVAGTKSGPPCSASPSDQDRGPLGPQGPGRRTGIRVHEPTGVTIQNLTVCNFLSGQDGSGNQIWFNLGYGPGQIPMHIYP